MAKVKQKPESANSVWVSHLGLLLAFVFLYGIHESNIYFSDDGGEAFTSDIIFLLSIACYAIPILIYDFFIAKVYRRETSGLDLARKPKRDGARIAVKLLGLYGTIAVLAFAYWLFPEYNKDTYVQFQRIAHLMLPYVVPVCAVYFIWLDGYMREPEDEYYQAGKFFLGQWKSLDTTRLAYHARGWLVKGFFLPMMVNYLYNNYELVLMYPFDGPVEFFLTFDFIITMLYIVDLLPTCIGYALSCRLTENHIRSTDPTLKGWVACLACYTPFWHGLLYYSYFPNMDGENWVYFFGDSPLRWLWAAMIITSLTIYASASVCFGVRWSNLTYRGLISTGVYGWTKHPAYIAKNFSWWLIAVPFMVEGEWLDSLKQIVFMLCVNFIYYQRAITEEKHLSQFPEYRDYADWMNDHGKLRFIGKLIPYFKYDAKRYGY